VIPLYAGFLYTGAMTVLLGVMLPRIAALHHLRDSQSGMLLLIQFATSATGGMFVRHRFRRTLLLGYILMACASIALLLLPGKFAVTGIGLWGLGLGMAMTSTSMLTGRVFPDSRGSALSLLNFFWSIGATLCPVVVARMPGTFSVASLYAPVAVLSAICVAVITPSASHLALKEDAVRVHGGRSALSTVILFSAIGFLYVGAETTIGGWMSTYASRAVSWNVFRSDLATACFWGALLVGRGVAPLCLLFVSESTLHRISMAGAAIGVLLLVSAHRPLVLLAGATCAGISLAPIFPLTLSLFMERAAGTRNAGWVFGVAGFGGAVFPWLTGVISSGTHSLRAGLLVTFAAVVGMSVLMLRVWATPSGQLKAAAAGV
jgi:fucose permease